MFAKIQDAVDMMVIIVGVIGPDLAQEKGGVSRWFFRN